MQPTWQEFIERYAKAVLDAAVRILAQSADAEDVAQEVFLEILKADRLNQLFDQPALVRTIATRRALDRLRKRRPHEPLDNHHHVAGNHEPFDYVVATELERRLRGAIACLPPREAEVFCLTYFESLSAREIATALQIAPGAVSKSLCAARNRLADALDTRRLDSQR